MYSLIFNGILAVIPTNAVTFVIGTSTVTISLVVRGRRRTWYFVRFIFASVAHVVLICYEGIAVSCCL